MINFNIEKGFIPCVATNVFQTEGFKKEEFHDIEIPKTSFLPKEYKPWVKDYILNPKASGYQSLHVVFQDPKTGRCFEIQIRTFAMHIHAESHSLAGHAAYKKQRYSDSNIDANLIATLPPNECPISIKLSMSNWSTIFFKPKT